MKKWLVVVIMLGLLALPLCASAQEDDYSWLYEETETVTEDADSSAAQTSFEGFDVYTDKFARSNHYIPSGWMGDYGDIRLVDNSKESPHSGDTCIKIAYTGEGTQGAGWCGIYWQNPANNWGNREGGFDLTGANKLTFWARGEKGGEVISEFKVGGISGTYPDSDATSIGPVTLTNEWKQYSIDLRDLDLSYIAGGFCFAASKMDNPEGFTLYLDDIRYE